MNLPSDTPRLPKLVFFLGWAALLVTAWLIWDNAAHPTAGLALLSVVGCVALAAVIVVIPFVSDYANRQDEALDNRQRSLQVLSVTVASAAEQVSIAATGLQGIAEAAQDNYSKSERLSKQIQEKMAELDARLASAKRDDGEIVARYEAAAKKIAKAAAEFEDAVSRASEAAARAAAIPVHIPELPPVIASRIVEIRPAVASSDAPFEAPTTPAEPVFAAPPEPAPPPEAVGDPRRPPRRPRRRPSRASAARGSPRPPRLRPSWSSSLPLRTSRRPPRRPWSPRSRRTARRASSSLPTSGSETGSSSAARAPGSAGKRACR